VKVTEAMGGATGGALGVGLGALLGPAGMIVGGLAGAAGGWWAGRGVAQAADDISDLGMRANSSRTVRLDNVFVPEQRLLGEQGDQLWYIFEVVAPLFLMAMAGTYIGVAAECVEAARVQLGSRRHSHTGELLGASPLLAHRLGELWLNLESSRQLVTSAARRADAGDPQALVPVLACKVAAARAAVDIANEAMTLAGGAA
jgi:isovaleryl-CoA dehydrogenase